jgi:hypothetical protein
MLVCILVFMAVMAFSQTSPNVCWEYTAISVQNSNPSEVTARSNQLGQEGCELVTGYTSSPAYGLIFKLRLHELDIRHIL